MERERERGLASSAKAQDIAAPRKDLGGQRQSRAKQTNKQTNRLLRSSRLNNKTQEEGEEEEDCTIRFLHSSTIIFWFSLCFVFAVCEAVQEVWLLRLGVEARTEEE